MVTLERIFYYSEWEPMGYAVIFGRHNCHHIPQHALFPTGAGVCAGAPLACCGGTAVEAILRKAAPLVPCASITGPYAGVNWTYTSIWISWLPVLIRGEGLRIAQLFLL